MISIVALLALGCAGGVDTVDTSPDTEVDTDDGLGQETDDPTVDNTERDLNLDSMAGQYWADFVTADKYTKIVIEVDYVSGRPPSQPILEDLAGRLEVVLNKPGGVTVEVDDRIPAQGNPTWSPEAAEQLEFSYRDRYRGFEEGTATIYLLYLDGQSQSDKNILGIVPHASSAYVFDREVDRAQDGSGHANPIDQAVLLNLVGRMAGLVNRGLPMVNPHEDTAHPGFSNDPTSVMAWDVASTAVAARMKDSPTLEFDADSLADLAAAAKK